MIGRELIDLLEQERTRVSNLPGNAANIHFQRITMQLCMDADEFLVKYATRDRIYEWDIDPIMCLIGELMFYK